jgi:signal transduction histidine kinase
MTNIARHANASRCRVQMAQQAGSLKIVVEDDGRGLVTGGRTADDRGLGLISVRERVAGLGGSLSLVEAPNGGTVLTVELPLAVAT